MTKTKVLQQVVTDQYAIYNGDSCEVIQGIPDNSIHFSVFSPPFASLYTYSNSDRDMGNCADDAEFARHFRFLIGELFRVIKPGRLVAIHCMNLPATITRDGFIGIKDFRGDIIRAFQESGFIYHSEVCIWKDPVTAMQRTKAIGLLHKQLMKDSALSRQGIPDYLVVMRKPGVNDEPVAGCLEYYTGTDSEINNRAVSRYNDALRFYQEWKGWTAEQRTEWRHNQGMDSDGWSYIYGEDWEPEMPSLEDEQRRQSIDIWQRYASPVWMDINPSNTLQYQTARENNDERHICPLQLDVIERAIQLWTNPGDTVLTPFMGIGSEVYQAVKMGRQAIGIELKGSYFNAAVKNADKAAQIANHSDTPLLDLLSAAS